MTFSNFYSYKKRVHINVQIRNAILSFLLNEQIALILSMFRYILNYNIAFKTHLRSKCIQTHEFRFHLFFFYKQLVHFVCVCFTLTRAHDMEML